MVETKARWRHRNALPEEKVREYAEALRGAKNFTEAFMKMRPDADRTFLRDVLALPNVDVGHGWLIFGLPPAEVAVHPAEKNNIHELYFMCDDIQAFVDRMKTRLVTCDPVQDQGWGLLTHITLPGGGKVGVYQPRHARPSAVRT